MFDLASEELVEAEAAIHEDLERERLSWRLLAFRGLTNTKVSRDLCPPGRVQLTTQCALTVRTSLRPRLGGRREHPQGI